MAEVSTGIGIKRRLPVWMLGANAMDKSREPEREDKKRDTEEMQLQPRTVRHNAKPSVEFVEDKIPPQTETASELESSISMGCKTKYVKADEEKRHQQKDTTCHKSKPVFPITSVLDKIRLGGSIQEEKSLSGPSRCTTVIHGGPAETSVKEHENPPSPVASSNPSKTGDAAQDMLDLLLGPLLKKPPVNEAKPKSLTEDIRLECELNSKRVIQSVDLGREQLVAAPKKKKSSLKEQIAVFLD
ncbi:hypothetical protein QJS10_CPA03g02542 [Acorus calamus]|uniref:Uncharacterized protein n=1 Tax=Acorus calamus TaxID=4465 RepID=A0AAV9F291_ACOCL|nr:hypothetical protein QJS10_CPA03g02542 [Acorus calamus]